MITDEVKQRFHEVAKRKQGNAELPCQPEKKERKRFFEGV